MISQKGGEEGVMRKDFSSHSDRMEKALKKVNVFYRSLPVVAVEGGMILYGRFTGDWTWAILGAKVS